MFCVLACSCFAHFLAFTELKKLQQKALDGLTEKVFLGGTSISMCVLIYKLTLLLATPALHT